MRRDYPQIIIGGRTVSQRSPLFVIAEIGLNHGGSVTRALELVDAAAASGASAIKLQTLIASGLVAPNAPAPAHVEASSMVEFFATFELDEEAHRQVVARARTHGLAVLATPLSESAVDLLERVGIDAYKIASGDITFRRLIERCARTGKPVVISTGMSDIVEVRRALGWARACGASGVALLHCVSSYPVPHGHENLGAIATLAQTFGCPVGLSDHAAESTGVPVVVALGGSLYERHIMLNQGDGSVDADVSSTPADFAAIVSAAARTSAAIGSGEKCCQPAERPNLIPSRRALFATRALTAGEMVQAADLIALRPGIGIPADRVADVVGRRVTRYVAAGTALASGDVALDAERTDRVA